MLDKTRLAKILAMTTSDNDGEALSAIRRANEVIKGEGLQWHDVVCPASNVMNITIQRQPMSTGPVDGEDRDWQPPHLKDASVIDVMFRQVYAQPRTGSDGFWEWLDSVHQQWIERKRLTSAQYNSLRRSYNRTRVSRV